MVYSFRKLVVVSIMAVMSMPGRTVAAPHEAGVNIIDSSGTVYMITADGTRRPYTSAGAFSSYGFNSFGKVQTANPEDLALPIGSFIPPQDGKILCADRGQEQGTCYLMSNGQKLGFVSEQVFRQLGFSFSRALYGDVSFVPAGGNIEKSDEAHRPGVLINKDGTVYLVGVTGLLGMPSAEVFNSWGYSFADVAMANAADRSLPLAGTIKTRVGGELTPAVSGASQTGFKILSPNGGEQVAIGQPFSLEWTPANLGSVEFVQIDLVEGPVAGVLPITDNFNFSTGKTQIYTNDILQGDVAQRIQPGKYKVKMSAYKSKTWWGFGYIGAELLATDTSDGYITFISASQSSGANQSSGGSGLNGSLTPAEERDKKRLGDVRQISAALELYFNDKGRYPASFSELAPAYMQALPIAPTPYDGSCTAGNNSYTYVPFYSGVVYALTFCLGQGADGYQAGQRVLTPTGIQ